MSETAKMFRNNSLVVSTN